MNRTKLPIRKRLENVLQFSGSVDTAVAEVGATNRLEGGVLSEQGKNGEEVKGVDNMVVKKVRSDMENIETRDWICEVRRDKCWKLSHIVYKNTSIRERVDFSIIPLDVIYGKLRIYELEQEQRAIIYGPGSSDSKSTILAKATALVAEILKLNVTPSSIIKEIVVAEIAQGEPYDESEFYTQEEIEELEEKSMAYMVIISHVRFRRKPGYKSRGSSGRFQKGSYSSGSSSRGGYKSSWIDKSKIRCYNCNELGHFVSECRKPRAAKGKDFYEKKEIYEDLKRKK
ncbi:hypothetical protein AgCh_020653 [Apium graveolens]